MKERELLNEIAVHSNLTKKNIHNSCTILNACYHEYSKNSNCHLFSILLYTCTCKTLIYTQCRKSVSDVTTAQSHLRQTTIHCTPVLISIISFDRETEFRPFLGTYCVSIRRSTKACIIVCNFCQGTSNNLNLWTVECTINER